MKAELKNLHSPDTHELKNYSPKESDDFCVLIQAMIGPSGDKGEESFDFVFCTPKWIEKLVEQDKFLIGRGYIIVGDYDYDLIQKTIQDLCDRASGSDWNTIANKISRYANWEFEDYRSS